jgi:hypothetical protein
VSVQGPPWLYFEPSRLLNFIFDADPDPNFDFDADPDLPFDFDAGPDLHCNPA